MMLPESMRKEKREMIANAAAFVNVFATGKMTVDLIKTLTEITPPKESQSGLLRIIYDSLARMHDGTEEGRKQALARANAAVNTIKYIWGLNEEVRELQKLKLISEAELNNARAAHERVLAELEPRKLNLKWEEFKLDEWYKKEWIKINWEKLNLERLELAAKQAQVKDTVLQDLKTIADTANKLHDAAVGVLEERLRELGRNDCANELRNTKSLSIVETALGRRPGECNEVVRFILTNPQDEKNRKVIQAIEGAQNAKLRAISLFNAVLGGEGLPTSPAPGAPTPGGTTPATPGAGGSPSGTAAPGGVTTPRPQDGTTGLRKRATELRQMGVPLPNDPKTAGAMTFIYALEGGPSENPFQIIPASGVAPNGPDRGFSAAVRADPTRQKAIEIDSAPALGVSWFLPTLARNPSVKVRYLDPKIVEANRPLFERAKYFGDDGVAVAAAYTAGALERAGFEIKYTPLFTTLMRTLAENDLGVLRMRKPLSQPEAERRFLNLVKSRYGSRYKEFGLGSPQELLDVAQNLYRATRLSTIGNLVLGGGR
jgi:hypothetical protein